jgi:hypothetical protein
MWTCVEWSINLCNVGYRGALRFVASWHVRMMKVSVYNRQHVT